MPNLHRSNKFVRELKKLLKKGVISSDQVEKFLKLMEDNPQHPSLRTKKIQGTDAIYEASISMAIRMTFHYVKPNTIYLRNVGEHNTLKDE